MITSQKQNVDKPDASPKRLAVRLKMLAILTSAAIAIAAAMYLGYMYVISPEAIRNPHFQHYHFRMQVLVNGKAENFGEQKYQTGYQKDLCNANLTEQPIHFHDNKDQMVHIHWDGMTGGMVLKYYGWNYIGGMHDALGYKLNNLLDIQKVTIHGAYLPKLPSDALFYVYTGDETGYREKSFNDFITRDLEDFFEKQSNLHIEEESITNVIDNLFFTKALAHDGENHSSPGKETSREQLTRINNLIGNVVIFAQKNRPTDAQIKERFADLEPLSNSTCGG